MISRSMSFGFNDTPFAKHVFVFHVRFNACDQIYSVFKDYVEEPWRDMPLFGKEFTFESLCYDNLHLRIPVFHIGSRKLKVIISPLSLQTKYSLSEAVVPSYRPLTVCSQVFEHLVGIAAKVMADMFHLGVYEVDTGTAAESREVQEEHLQEEHTALQFHEAVVRYSIGEVRL